MGNQTFSEYSPQLPGMNTRQAGNYLNSLGPEYTKTIAPANERNIYSGRLSPFPWTSQRPEGMTKAEMIGAIPKNNYAPGQARGGEASGMTVDDIYGQMQTANQSMLDAGSKPLYTDQQMGIGLAPGANDWMYDNSLPRPHEQNQNRQGRGGYGSGNRGNYGGQRQQPSSLGWNNQGGGGGQSQIGALPMGNQSPGINSLTEALAGPNPIGAPAPGLSSTQPYQQPSQRQPYQIPGGTPGTSGGGYGGGTSTGIGTVPTGSSNYWTPEKMAGAKPMGMGAISQAGRMGSSTGIGTVGSGGYAPQPGGMGYAPQPGGSSSIGIGYTSQPTPGLSSTQPVEQPYQRQPYQSQYGG